MVCSLITQSRLQLQVICLIWSVKLFLILILNQQIIAAHYKNCNICPNEKIWADWVYFSHDSWTSKNRFQNKINISPKKLAFVHWFDIFSLLHSGIYHRKMESFWLGIILFSLHTHKLQANGCFPVYVGICFLCFIVT